MLRQFFATILQAVRPQPTLERLRQGYPQIRERLHEGKRKRVYQHMSRLF
jgi:hypothetical protein